MCALTDKTDIVSEIILETEYPEEKFNFTWKISDYSMIQDSLRTSFSTRSKATEWELKLKLEHQCRRIYIKRNFDGEPVYVIFQSRIESCHGPWKDEMKKVFKNNSEWVKIYYIPEIEYSAEGFEHPLQFENDEFIFHCSMTIVGHTITSIKNISDAKRELSPLLNSQEHCDMSISDGMNGIPLHKDIICAKSPVFHKMFQLGMLEHANDAIEIDDVDFDILEEFVCFLYSEEVENLCWDRAQKLYCVADKYEVIDLRKKCSQFLQFHLTVGEACSVLKLADQYMDDTLKEAAIFFIQMHASSVKITKGWKDLVKTHPKLALETLK